MKSLLILASIVVLSMIGIVGMQESFATEGWEINETGISLVEYEFPLQASYDNHTESEYPMYFGDYSFTISNLPKLGETAEIEFIFTNGLTVDLPYENLDNVPIEDIPSEFFKIISITDVFEFVDEPTALSYEDKHYSGSALKEVLETLSPNESFTMSATIKAVSEGFGRINAHVLQDTSRTFYIQVMENETLLYEDYIKKYPQEIEQANNTSEPEPALPPTVVTNVSPKKQLELGIVPEDIICKEDHVLVLRTNGNPACVSEKTSEKLNWWEIKKSGLDKILELYDFSSSSSQNIEYVFPLKAETMSSEGNGEPYEGLFVIANTTLTDMPKLGEEVEIILTATNYVDRAVILREGDISIIIFDEYNINSNDYQDNTYYGFSPVLNFDIGETKVLTYTVKAVKEGESSIKVSSGTYWKHDLFEFVVGENETLLSSDYFTINPNALTKEEAYRTLKEAEKQVWIEKGCDVVATMVACPPGTEGYNIDDYAVTTEVYSINSIEELIDDLRRTGNTDAMIDEILKQIVNTPIYGTIPEGEPKFGDISISISKLPNLGETAVVTVADGELERGQPKGRDTAPLSISISPQFEFVDLEPTRTGNGYTIYEIEIDIIDKESISFSATIKAIGEGNGRITGFSDYNNPNTPETIQMIISENTVLGAIIDP